MRKAWKAALCTIVIIALLVAELLVIVQYNRMGTEDVLQPETQRTNNASVTTERVNDLDLKSNRYTHMFDDRESLSKLTTDGFEFLLGNDRIEIWLRPDNYDIRVVNLESGYIWGGIEESTTKDMNKRWKSTAASLVTVNYLDKQLSEKTLYMADSKTTRSHTISGDTATFTAVWDSIDLTLQFTLTLNSDGFTIAMKDNAIIENPASPITSISFLPFFGSARLDEINGYFFLPDGSGALMRFAKGRDYISTYAKDVYGSDLGVKSAELMNNISDITSRPVEFMIAQPEIMMPVFGVVHGVEENAFWVEIDSGAPYASLLADAATTRLNYHYARSQFVYRECYIQPTSKNGTGVRTVSSERNVVNPSQTYYFLSGAEADYVGMAVAWREKLTERGALTELEGKASIPMQLEVISAVRSHGYLGNETLVATTANDVMSMAEDLHASGVQNTLFTMLGWMKGGHGGYRFNKIRTEEGVADLETLQTLSASVKAWGHQLLLSFDPVRMMDDQFTIKTDIATKISQQQLMANGVYYRRNEHVPTGVSRVAEYLRENQLSGVVAGVGELLYSDHIKGEETTREEAMKIQQEIAAETEIVISAWQTPHAYLWQNVKQAMKMPDSASQYQYITDTVPFMQIVLHGSMDCFSDYLNQGAFSRSNILHLIEYGQYPAFLISQEDNYSLRNSVMYDVYSTQYDTWVADVKATWVEINAVLLPVANAQIINHTVLAEGFVCMEYDNGYAVYVNYTLDPVTRNEVTVPAQSALTVKQP